MAKNDGGNVLWLYPILAENIGRVFLAKDFHVERANYREKMGAEMCPPVRSKTQIEENSCITGFVVDEEAETGQAELIIPWIGRLEKQLGWRVGHITGGIDH
ncbi:hypothetical protein FOPE_02164 [Fonsecaea pedrosoi]|nr:hypothetical protein FOPE_02164 [Fonsecaea pedrosoi]